MKLKSSDAVVTFVFIASWYSLYVYIPAPNTPIAPATNGILLPNKLNAFVAPPIPFVIIVVYFFDELNVLDNWPILPTVLPIPLVKLPTTFNAPPVAVANRPILIIACWVSSSKLPNHSINAVKCSIKSFKCGSNFSPTCMPNPSKALFIFSILPFALSCIVCAILSSEPLEFSIFVESSCNDPPLCSTNSINCDK